MNAVYAVKSDGNDEVTKVVNAVCVDEWGKLLLVLLCDEKTGRYCWIFPGGKKEPGESLEDAIARELREELNGAIFRIESTFYPDVFRGRTPFSGKTIEVQFCEVSLIDDSNMRASREISAFCWVLPEQARYIILNGGYLDGYPVSSVTIALLEHLLDNGNGHVFMV